MNLFQRASPRTFYWREGPRINDEGRGRWGRSILNIGYLKAEMVMHFANTFTQVHAGRMLGDAPQVTHELREGFHLPPPRPRRWYTS